MTDTPLEPLKIPIGLPSPKEIDEEVIKRICRLNCISQDEAFETYGKASKFICYLCGRSIDMNSMENNIFLGIPVCAYPTEVTQLEREGQSNKSIEYNKKLESGEVVKNSSDLYNPFPKTTIYDKSIEEFKDGEVRSRLIPEIVPCFVCQKCRRVGGRREQSHDERIMMDPHKKISPNTNLLPLTMKDRNMINPYKQHSFAIGCYKDNDGKRYDWNNRLTIVFMPNQADRYHDNWLEQLDLFQGIEHTRLKILCDSPNGKTEFFINLEHSIRKTILPLLRSSIALFMKKAEAHQDKPFEIQDFEEALQVFLFVLRMPIYFITKYPTVGLLMRQNIAIWNANPFSKDARKLFDGIIDVNLASFLSGMDNKSIMRSLLMAIIGQILVNGKDMHKPNITPETKTGDKMSELKTYFRKLYNEGRNKSIILNNLIVLALTNGFRQIPINELGDYMDKRCCSIPWKNGKNGLDFLNIWKDILAVKEVDSIPALWNYLGMVQTIEDDKILDEIWNFVTMVRNGVPIWVNSTIPESIKNKIRKMFSSKMEASSSSNVRERLHELERIKERELVKEYIKHQGYPSVDPETGDVSFPLKKCLYCEKEFDSSQLLYNHVSKYCKVYDWETRKWKNDPFDEFHVNHRYMVNRLCTQFRFNNENIPDEELREKVIEELKKQSGENGTLNCPYDRCDQKDRKFTVEELVDHFKALGIGPFWYPGCEMPQTTHLIPFYGEDKPIEQEKNDTGEREQLRCSWENPGMCSFCLSSPVDGINIPCGHAETCQECYDEWSKRNKHCGTCRGVVKYRLPIVMNTSVILDEQQIHAYFVGIVSS